MLAKAESKGIYASFLASWLEPGTPTRLGPAQYDVVASAGGFVAGHLKPGVLAEFARLAKPGTLGSVAPAKGSFNERHRQVATLFSAPTNSTRRRKTA